MPLPQWYPERGLHDNAIAVLKNYILHSEVPVTFSSVEHAVKSNSGYPNVSLSDLGAILKHWGVETKVVKVSVTDFTRVYFPAIAFINSNAGTFVLLYSLSGGQLLYVHPRLGWVEESVEEFFIKSQGILLLAIPVKGCGEEGFEQKRAGELEQQLRNPLPKKVSEFTGFLSKADCEHLIAIATPLFRNSEVVSAEAPEAHQGRSSYTAMLDQENDPVLHNIYQRASELLQLPVEHLEYGQCVSYSKGQEYQAHFDTVDEQTAMGQKLAQLYGQRAVTMLIYLNDDFEGGETYFPLLDQKVTPSQGTAVVFKNLGEDNRVDPFALHAGLPVFSGRKYAMNIWGWTRPFRQLHH